MESRNPISGEITNITKINKRMSNTKSFLILSNFIGFLGMISFWKTAETENPNFERVVKREKCYKTLQLVLRVWSSLIIVTAILGSMMALKNLYVSELATTLTKLNSVILFQYVNQVIIYAGLLYLVWGNKFATPTSETKSYFEKGDNFRIHYASALILAIIFMSSCLLSMFSYGVTENEKLNLTRVIESYTEFISAAVQKWDLSNDTTHAYKLELYKNDTLQPSSLFWGLTGWMVAVSITVLDFCTLTIFVLAAKAAYQFVKDLELKQEGESITCDMEAELHKYELLVTETNFLNRNIGLILIFLHLQVIILGSFILRHLGWSKVGLYVLSPLLQLSITLVGHVYGILLSRRV